MALQVTQVKSSNGAKHNQLATLETLGLRRIRHTVVVPDTDQFRGMVATVNHLVAVSEVADDTVLARDASRQLSASDAGESGQVGEQVGTSAATEALLEEQGLLDEGADHARDVVQLPNQNNPMRGEKVKGGGGDDEDDAAEPVDLLDVDSEE